MTSSGTTLPVHLNIEQLNKQKVGKRVEDVVIRALVHWPMLLTFVIGRRFRAACASCGILGLVDQSDNGEDFNLRRCSIAGQKLQKERGLLHLSLLFPLNFIGKWSTFEFFSTPTNTTKGTVAHPLSDWAWNSSMYSRNSCQNFPAQPFNDENLMRRTG